MEEETKVESPFACDMNSMSAAERERHGVLVRKMLGAGLERREVDSGYAFRLDGNRIALAEAAEWVSLESKCCPFFDFRIDLAREGGPIWLTVAGRPGAKEFIRAEFGF